MNRETIRLEVDGDGIAWLTFDRPEVRNALNLTMVREVRAALEELTARDDVRVLVFLGSDKAFVSGADIAELRERGRLDALRRINSDLFRDVERFPAPTIAAIRGYALGGGCELALACDLRVAGEGAKLGQPEVSLGILPGAGATYRLPRLVGLGRARELIFTGRIIRAGEALSIGLVERVVPDAEVPDAARALAREIARNSSLAVRLAKMALNHAAAGVEVGQALESTAQAVLFDDPEKRARMTEFLERRKRPRAPRAEAARVKVTGAVAEELELDLDGLRALPAEAQVDDVGRRVPGRVGRAVRLGALIARARPTDEARHVTVTSADGAFSSTLPREGMKDALLVYALHDRPLPPEQGGPYRLLIPDAEDKCANVKQVARVELGPEPGENRCSHTAAQHERMRGGS